MMRGVASSRKSKTRNRQRKTWPCKFVTVRLWFSRCFINPYIFK